MTPTQAIHKLLKTEYAGKRPYDINNGNCEDFAWDILKKLGMEDEKEGWLVWVEEYGVDAAHCVVEIGGKFYDAENPRGVKDVRRLNVVKHMGDTAYHEKMRESTKTIDGFRKEGTEAWFEYHCQESAKSADAELWYRSHQRVTVLDCDNVDEFGDLSFVERAEAGVPLVYKIRFEDGFEGAAFEDELVDNPEEFCRPEPPKRKVLCS